MFRQMQALKVGVFCTNQTRVTMAARMAPFAAKSKIRPAWHPHDNIDSPVEVATAETLEKLLADVEGLRRELRYRTFHGGQRRRRGVPEEAPRPHHAPARQDRRRNHGPNVQLGEGRYANQGMPRARSATTKWPIYALLEREYRGRARPSKRRNGRWTT